jgi:predicted ribosome quality control (RQC) complex YloA/Tae2 family protein
MDDGSISAVVAEIAPLLIGRGPGKLFQLGPFSLAIDFGLRDRGLLFISVEPAQPRLYLIKRRVRDLEKQSSALGHFALWLKKELSHTAAVSIDKDDGERVVRLHFAGNDELGREHERVLLIQLTGRAANLFLLSSEGTILSQARAGRGVGQLVGEKYQPPPQQGIRRSERKSTIDLKGNSVSEALDAHYSASAAERDLQTQEEAAQAKLRKQISQRRKLLTKLEADLASHANYEQHKRIGDLLLANVASAKRTGNRVRFVDYFAEGAPECEIELDEKVTLPEEAASRFEMYSRSKRALRQITARIKQVKSEIAQLSEPTALVGGLLSEPPASAGRLKPKPEKKIPGTRRYLSSDGFEILVGRAAKDNDNLTFKIARPNDLWLHAADYPGSHVVVRNPTRKDVPHRTLIEAAQLAAYFSHAKQDPKVDVHYTQRKFLSKPKGAAPGLVRMSRFKSMTVQPNELKRLP